MIVPSFDGHLLFQKLDKGNQILHRRIESIDARS